ncbi:MAG: outer membrane protein assembly factor BamA [Mariprofundaceae bacterium]|nr:outer membrane protein assembly factor BamA [Mariprofundaceae bacterium]
MMRVQYLWVLLCLLWVSGHSVGEVAAASFREGLTSSALIGKKIVGIKVAGNRYLESAAILASLTSKVGGVFKRRALSRDIQKMYATGNYADLKVSGSTKKGGVQLIFHVRENPFITDYRMDGNEEVTYKDMKRKLKLKEGVIFSEAKLRSDINTIRKGYVKEGYYQLKVNAEKEILADGGLKLRMHVIEGAKTYIQQLRFIGNENFSDAKLADEVSASVSGLLSWVSNKNVIDTKKFANDGQKLIEFYQNKGFLDIKIESSQLSLTPNKEDFYLTFSLHEGALYHVRSLDVQGDMEPTKEQLLKAITMQEGQVYSVSDLRETIDKLSLLVGDEGYAFNSVTPLFKRDVADRTVGIVFDIEKGREVYIERIEIEGNEKTDDGVLRREMRIDESERYSATKMKLSKEALTRSPLFKDVRISMPRGSADDRVNTKIKVEEDQTGSLIVGAGFSQLEKVMFRVKTSQKNLFGKGYAGNLTADVGQVTQNFNVSLTDPYFMDTNIATTLTLSKTQTKLNTALSTARLYTQDDFGGGLSLSIPVSESLNYGIGYRYTNSNLTDIDPYASFLLRSQAGKQITSELTQTFSFETRDRFISTTKGFTHRVSLGVAGLGGNNRFWEAGATLKGFLPLAEDFVLSAGMEMKTIQGYSGVDVPIYRRYSLGGIGSVRGFDYFGISLRESGKLDPIGGDKQLTGALNFYFPFPYVQTEGFRAVLFSDIGTVWGNENLTNISTPFSVSSIRASAGFGIEWTSPVGPVTLSWAKVLKKQPGDVLRTFEFGLGRSF